jgi:hypothetical protein
MASVAANVAAHKVAHPDLYCPARRCLWRTGGGRCPRHPMTASERAWENANQHFTRI